ncbi:hypothetical protein ACSBR1_035174 [Camellia fascicularis]
MLQNNVDMDNMICLARSFKLQIIGITVRQDVGVRTWIHSNVQLGNKLDSPVRDEVLNNLDMYDEVNLLQTFCPHNGKVFLLELWARGFTHIGQHFEGGASEFRNVMCKQAVECEFQYKYVKNDSLRITAICAMTKMKASKWKVYARKLEANEFFYLRKWVSEHICSVVVRTSKNLLVGSKLVADIMADRVRDRPLTRPIEVILDMKQDFSLDITYRVAGAVKEHNSGSYINIEYDDHTHRFTRYFISFKACINGFTHCRPLLFLDATFLKGRFKGFLLAATAKDDNQGLFLLAYAIVDSKNTTNWSWFLQHLTNVLNGNRPLTFVSDRNARLLDAMPIVFLNAKHAFCL